MPGVYLVAIAVSFAGMLALDLRFRLLLRGPARPGGLVVLAAILVGVAFFTVWDLVAIALGVFVQGDSPLYLGIELAPHLPIEEIAFLTFLSYLALVLYRAGLRLLERGEERRA